MAQKPTMLTLESHKKLEEELSELINVKRKENEQAILEARITTIEAILKTAVIIDESDTSNENVHLTSKVKIEVLETGTQAEYTIVGSGSNEADPAQGKISDDSPICAAVMGKSVGDVAEVETPGGMITVKILEISK